MSMGNGCKYFGIEVFASENTALSSATRAYSSPFTGEGHQEIVAARTTSNTSTTMLEYSTVKISTVSGHYPTAKVAMVVFIA